MSSYVSARIVRVAIIGSRSFATTDKTRPGDLHEMMIWRALDQIENVWHLDPSHVEVVSGGCSGADAVATTLGVRRLVSKCVIHLPCGFERAETQRGVKTIVFKPEKGTAFSTLMTRVHQDALFSRDNPRGYSALAEMREGIDADPPSVALFKHATTTARNREIANSSHYLIAFVEDKNAAGEPVERSGTHQTWTMFDARKPRVCFSLSDLGIERPQRLLTSAMTDSEAPEKDASYVPRSAGYRARSAGGVEDDDEGAE